MLEIRRSASAGMERPAAPCAGCWLHVTQPTEVDLATVREFGVPASLLDHVADNVGKSDSPLQILRQHEAGAAVRLVGGRLDDHVVDRRSDGEGQVRRERPRRGRPGPGLRRAEITCLGVEREAHRPRRAVAVLGAWRHVLDVDDAPVGPVPPSVHKAHAAHPRHQPGCRADGYSHLPGYRAHLGG